MKIVITETQLLNLKNALVVESNQVEFDERARTLANARKMRLFPKSALKSNPDRFKHFTREKFGLAEKDMTDAQIKSIEKLNQDAKFLTCKNCGKKFTQTTYKKKKSLPICPHCGTHNVEQK